MAANDFQIREPNRWNQNGQFIKDVNNLGGISDQTQREAEQSFLGAFQGTGQNGDVGIWHIPSFRKGRISYDQIKEQYLQNWYRDKIKQNQVNAYNAFDPDKYIKSNADIYRRNLADQVVGAKKQVRGNENSRGMLFSGRRQNEEGQVGIQADQNFQQYQQQLVQDALQKKQQLAADPLQGIAGGSAADLQRALQSQQMQQQLQGQQSQFIGSGLGLIGQGIGSYYGSKDKK